MGASETRHPREREREREIKREREREREREMGEETASSFRLGRVEEGKKSLCERENGKLTDIMRMASLGRADDKLTQG